MGDFFIGNTNFGVEAEKSYFDLTKAADGRLLLSVEIRGNEKVYHSISADEESEWSWTLYPPYFYLGGYTVPEQVRGNERTIKLKPEDYQLFDVALYLMEHNNVEGVTIKVSEIRIEISG